MKTRITVFAVVAVASGVMAALNPATADECRLDDNQIKKFWDISGMFATNSKEQRIEVAKRMIAQIEAECRASGGTVRPPPYPPELRLGR